MTMFPANGFEIDEDDPQVPLIAIAAAADYVREFSANRMAVAAINEFIDRLGIPMHILAETDQHLHG